MLAFKRVMIEGILWKSTFLKKYIVMILQTFALGCCLMIRSTDRLCKGSDDPVQMKYQMSDH